MTTHPPARIPCGERSVYESPIFINSIGFDQETISGCLMTNRVKIEFVGDGITTKLDMPPERLPDGLMDPKRKFKVVIQEIVK